MASGGRFFSFEGIDGSGKSTQARLLADALRERGHDIVLTREPGGSPGAEEIRRLVLEGDPERWSPETELLLFTAARRDHLEKTIRPALDRGAVVISDRFADSTRMYQGASRGDLRAAVDALHDLLIGMDPDLTLLIDLDAERGLARSLGRLTTETAAAATEAVPATMAAGTRSVSDHGERAADARALARVAGSIANGSLPEDRFESFGPQFQSRMRAGFLALAADHPDRFRVIDGSAEPDVVAARVLAAVLPHLAG